MWSNKEKYDRYFFLSNFNLFGTDKRAGIDPNRLATTTSTTTASSTNGTASSSTGTSATTVTTFATAAASVAPQTPSQSPSVSESLLGALNGSSVTGIHCHLSSDWVALVNNLISHIPVRSHILNCLYVVWPMNLTFLFFFFFSLELAAGVLLQPVYLRCWDAASSNWEQVTVVIFSVPDCS